MTDLTFDEATHTYGKANMPTASSRETPRWLAWASKPKRGDIMETFDDWSEAFDYCRECNEPVTVIIQGDKYKLFPSGTAHQLA